jgi:molybdopterin-dependent oxidoreductase alpha subunit
MSNMNRSQKLESYLRDRFPFGIMARNKPRHFTAIAETARDTFGQWHKAWKVLNGPCNGCAVQTDGLRDNVLPNSPHFCLVRLGLIEEVLRRDADPNAFASARGIASMGNDRIERLGRITQPLLWNKGDNGYKPITFQDAYSLAGKWLKEHRGDRSGFFSTSKAVGNEEYYAFQQFARVVGNTNNVDSCARQCHAASVSALKSSIGAGVSSGSLSDFMDTDVLVLAGTNLANNQPLVMRYIEHGRSKRRGKPYVIVVNTYREPGLERYWVPSSPKSAVFGSRICDEFIQVRTGGDVAFFNGVLKILIENQLLTNTHRTFIDAKTTGFENVAESLANVSLRTLAKQCGVSAEQMRRVAMVLARCENALFCWGMGLTQHQQGTDNVKSVVNLALALGQFGKPKAGVAPLRGQSGVQASGECGVAPDIFPGGSSVSNESAASFSERWGAKVPANPGMVTGQMIKAAHRGDISLLMCLGGNLRETMPDRSYIQEALNRVPFRIRFDVMMNSEAMIEPGQASLVIPIRNWYEWDSVFTTTSTDRTIRAFCGTIEHAHRDLPESWRALRSIAQHVVGQDLPGFRYDSTQQIRNMMNQTILMYRGIDQLSEPHKQMQWGGPFLFADGFTNMPNNRAVFTVLKSNPKTAPDGQFVLSTRRGFGQWNSQHRPQVTKDSFTHATTRKAILMHPGDAATKGLKKGDTIVLTANHGASSIGVCWPDQAVRPGHVQAFWPIANDLIRSGVYDPPSQEPDYNAIVTIDPA